MVSKNLFHELEQRGIVKQITDPELGQKISAQSLTLYCGFDPTSDSLHVGSLLPLLTLRRFQNAGHRVIAVVGGATGMIGDPSFKSTERSLLTNEVLEKNLAGITRVVSQFLKLDGDLPARVINNADFFKGVSYIDFLRDVGKHFTINHMIAKESVRARLEDREHGISYTEFSYMLLQAYDFYCLNQKFDCTLQIGGSDQWGNITAGTELIRRMRAHGTTGSTSGTSSQHPIRHAEVYGLTHPLVTKADGTKFGKSESGTVWLDPNKTTPYELYQFFLQTQDADVIQYLHFFSFRSLQEIAELAARVQSAPEKREAQTALAQEMVELIHGREAVTSAISAAQALFSRDITTLDEQGFLDSLKSAPTTRLHRTALASGKTLIDLLAETGLCSSKGAARKDIQGGGIYVNSRRIEDINETISADQLLHSKYLALRKGKKNYHLVVFDTE